MTSGGRTPSSIKKIYDSSSDPPSELKAIPHSKFDSHSKNVKFDEDQGLRIRKGR